MIAALLLAAAAPSPSIVYTIDPKHRVAEGIASDGTDLWVSSILDRAILRCAATCKTAFTLAGPGYPLGIAWDPSRQWLWIAMHCLEIKGIQPCEGELRAVDRTGRIKFSRRPRDGFKPGDVSVHHGVVSVSDSANGAVYRWANKRFSTVLQDGVGKSAQGSATFRQGRRLVVSDYSRGIFVYPIPYGPRMVTRLKDGRAIQGIDGLIAVGNRLFGIYNGRSPGKLLELTIDQDTIAFTEIADGGLLPDPTQVTFHNGSLYVIGDSGWATIDKHPVRAAGATIVRIPLPKGAD